MKRLPPSVRSILFSLIIALIITVLYLAGIFESAENLSYDTVIRLEGEQPRDSSLILVAIDEASLKKLGRWPWPRSTTAYLLEAISDGEPATIGIDIGFFEPGPEDSGDDERLNAATEKSGRVIYPVYLADLPSLGEIVAFQKPFAGLAAAAAGLGHVHVEPSMDGVVRKVYLQQECGEESVPAFAVKCVESYLSRTGKESTVRFTDDGIAVGEIFIPTVSRTAGDRDETAGLITQDHMLYIRFAGPSGTFLSLPAWEVLKDGFPRELFRDKIVLIGATAAGLGDVSMTPFSTERRPMPGVELQANIINTILTKNSITRPGAIWTIAAIFLLSLATGWIFSGLTTRGSILAFLLLLITVVGLYFLLLFQTGIWIDAWPLLAVILGNYLTVTVQKLGSLFRALDGEIKNLSRTQKFAPPLPRSPDEEGLMRTLFSFLTSLLAIDTALLLVFEPGEKKLIVRRTWGKPEPAREDFRFPVPPILGDLSEPLEVHGLDAGEHFPWRGGKDRSCLLLPLAVSGQRLGFLLLGRNRETPFGKDEIATGKIIAHHLGYAIRKLDDYSQALDRTESSLHFFHPGGMEEKIRSLKILSRAMTYEQLLLISMLESVADGVIISDLLGNILLCNPRAGKIINIPEDETGKSTITEIFPKLLDMPKEEFSGRLQRIIGEKETFTREVTIGKSTYILSLSSISRGEGISGGIMAVFTDITYLKELDRLRAETMAMLTHEIKNPLSGILGFCDLFIGGEVGPEEISEYIHLIKDSVDGLQKLVVDYLAAARLESGALELIFSPLDLPSIIEDAITLLSPQAQEKDIRIEREFAIDLPGIEGDAGMLQRACGNLIGNAIQYSPAGTEIMICLSLLANRITLQVKDRGCGIAPEDRAKIFEKFYRSDRTRNITGTGLGLAITREIVERHGGSIRVEEREGGGSVFIVEFKTMSDT